MTESRTTENLLHLLQSSGAGLNAGWLRGKFPFVFQSESGTIDEAASSVQLSTVAVELQPTLGTEQHSRRLVASGAAILQSGQLLTELRAALQEVSSTAPIRQSTEAAFVEVQAEQESAESLVLELIHDRVNGVETLDWNAATAALCKNAQFLLSTLAGLTAKLSIEEPAAPSADRLALFAANIQRMANVLRDLGSFGVASTKDIMAAIGVEDRPSEPPLVK